MEGSKNHVRVKPTELQPYAPSMLFSLAHVKKARATMDVMSFAIAHAPEAKAPQATPGCRIQY